METKEVLDWFEKICDANPKYSNEFYRLGMLLTMMDDLKEGGVDATGMSIDTYYEKGRLAALHVVATSMYANLKYLTQQTNVGALIKERLESMLEDEMQRAKAHVEEMMERLTNNENS